MKANKIVPPIIVDENGDVSLFYTIEDAEVWMEAVDVLNNEYRFFDSQGNVLLGEVGAGESSQNVKLVLAPDSLRKEEEARGLVYRLFERLLSTGKFSSDPDIGDNFRNATLQELLNYYFEWSARTEERSLWRRVSTWGKKFLTLY